MSEPTPARFPVRPALAVACFLLFWNGLLGLYGNPLLMVQRYDGTQYHLLVRNRLRGHYEVGDTAHTVRREGRHPMWRPGIVWVEEALSPLSGSVGTAAVAASVIGTTLCELAALLLAWAAFGSRTALAALALLVLLPLNMSSGFALMAIGQGPEPWAAAALLVGLVVLAAGLRRPNAPAALAAGLAAGLSEVFRSGNLFVFAGACGVFVVRDLWRRDWRRLAVSAAALAAFAATSAWAGRLVPSGVDKHVANAWGVVLEQQGPRLTEPHWGMPTVLVGGLQVVAGSDETGYDYLVHHARGQEARQFLRDHAGFLWSVYCRHLSEVFRGGAFGLLSALGGPVLFLFALQIVASLVRPDEESWTTFALVGGVAVQYLGPLTLMRGEIPTHYLLLLLGLVLVVAARGLVRCTGWAAAALSRWRPAPALLTGRPGFSLALAVAPLACVAAAEYRDVLYYVREHHGRARQEQRDLDALGLDGRRLACRNMSWFVDRDVETVLLPYATVPELERYAAAHDLDGLLFWDHEEFHFFRAMPQDDAALDRQLLASPVFGAVRRSGAWRYYPVQRSSATGG